MTIKIKQNKIFYLLLILSMLLIIHYTRTFSIFWIKPYAGAPKVTQWKNKLIEKKMCIQIRNIWYYNIYILKLKLSIKYFNLNITVTYAEKVSMFTRQISDTRLSQLW